MDSQALAAFTAIVDYGSFSEAAESLHLTQPAVSKRLAALEQQLGQVLLERGQRKLVLTEAGAQLLPYARRILDEMHNARLDLSARSTEIVRGRLNIIASHHIGLHHLPAWLRRFNREFPEVDLDLQFMDSETAYDTLSRRQCELALVTLTDAMDSRFVVHGQWDDPMAFVAGKTHPLAQKTHITLAEMAEYNALLPAAKTYTYRVVNRLFMAENLNLKPKMPTNYLETIKVLTGVGLGWSVLPQGMVDSSLVTLKPLPPVVRLLGAVGLGGRQLSPAAKALLEIVRELH